MLSRNLALSTIVKRYHELCLILKIHLERGTLIDTLLYIGNLRLKELIHKNQSQVANPGRTQDVWIKNHLIKFLARHGSDLCFLAKVTKERIRNTIFYVFQDSSTRLSHWCTWLPFFLYYSTFWKILKKTGQ